jgi:hypothetical protein
VQRLGEIVAGYKVTCVLLHKELEAFKR